MGISVNGLEFFTNLREHIDGYSSACPTYFINVLVGILMFQNFAVIFWVQLNYILLISSCQFITLREKFLIMG